MIKKDFVLIDKLGADLSNLRLIDFMEHSSTLIRGVNNINLASWIEFSLTSSLHHALPYDGKPYYSFNDEAFDEVALHYDGISARRKEKIPEWLVFWVEEKPADEEGGMFMLANGEKVLQHISPDLRLFLRTAHLQFSDYVRAATGQVQNEFTIQLIDMYHDKEILRLFLPSSHQDRQRPDSEKCISGKTIEETNAIFKEIRHALYLEEILTKIRLQEDDILIVNNKIFLHGRERFSRPAKRILNRVQLCQNIGSLPDHSIAQKDVAMS